MKDRKLINQVCESCGKQFKGPLPEICCNKAMCGCNGDPAFPAVCSNECFDKLMKGVDGKTQTSDFIGNWDDFAESLKMDYEDLVKELKRVKKEPVLLLRAEPQVKEAENRMSDKRKEQLTDLDKMGFSEKEQQNIKKYAAERGLPIMDVAQSYRKIFYAPVGDVIEDLGDPEKVTVGTDGKTSCPKCNSAEYYHDELLFINHKDDTDRRCAECDAYIAIRRNGKWFFPEK